MAGSRLVNSGSVLLCPHGAPVTIAATGFSARMPNGLVPAKSTDAFVIAGCPFVAGDRPSPCLRVQWLVTNAAEPIDGVPSLDQRSMGICIGASGVPQGAVIIAQV